jgi:hypothetical protein
MNAMLLTDGDAIVANNADLPAELQGPTPREIPDAVKQGRLYLRNRKTVWTLAVLGLGCLLADELPFVQTLALYFLPLGYLLWIGIGLSAIAVYAYLAPPELKKAKRYIEQGEAGFGYVTSLIKTPTLIYNGQPTQFAIVAQVRMQHPQTGAPCTKDIKSRNLSNKANESRFRVGDVVPVVWLPGQFDSTAQIYDFLEIMPGRDLVTPSEATSLGKAIALIIVVAVLLPALFWCLYAAIRYSPIDFSFRQGVWPFAVGGVAGLAITICAALVSVQKRRRLIRKNEEATASGGIVEVDAKRGIRDSAINWVILPAGAVMLGGMTTLGMCYTANGLFDKSVAKPVPIVVTQMIQETHGFIIRNYQMKYRRANEQEIHSLLTTPQHLSQFTVPFGIAQVRSGWLGWPWVETIDPIKVAPPGAAQK